MFSLGLAQQGRKWLTYRRVTRQTVTRPDNLDAKVLRVGARR